MIDTHSHVLPGLDDGAGSLDASIAMAKRAWADGVRTIVATPHMREGDFLNERPKVMEAVEAFREALLASRIPLEILPGAEVYIAPRLVERIQTGKILTFNDRGAYILLECPYRNRPMRLEEAIFELKVAGITPVLAHPERIKFFQEELGRYEECLRLGALGQLTSSSLLGHFGGKVAALSEQMVRRGMVHVLASDSHDDEYRPPVLSAARARWAELAGEDSARSATLDVPRALIEGLPFEVEPPLPEEAPRRFFGLFRRKA